MHVALLETDTVVLLEDGRRLTDSSRDLTVALSNLCWNVEDLETPLFSLPPLALELLKGLEEEGLYEVGLELTGLCHLHLLSDL
ncbi:hypothetical protein D3C86_1665710 [compost metagenome]